MSQGIGLHVSTFQGTHATSSEKVENELRRRTWYSIYVLDRLLALQLGRPVGIHTGDFDVEVPSRDEMETINTSSDHPSQSRSNQEGETDGREEVQQVGSIFQSAAGQEERASFMEYFLNVIQFSHILGRVIKELYHPTQVESSPESMLSSTSSLDQSLREWKLNLPRHLRFDLGHTFEKSTIFKRQVRMMEIFRTILIYEQYILIIHAAQHACSQIPPSQSSYSSPVLVPTLVTT